MDVAVEELPQQGLVKEFRISVPASEVSTRLEAQIEKLSKTVELKGFRKGHVPAAHIKQRYGEELIRDITRDLIAETSNDFLKKHALAAITQPSAQIESDPKALLEGGLLTYKISVEVAPDFTLMDLTMIELERIVTDLSDSDVSEALNALAERNIIFEEEDAKRPAEEDDRVVVDIIGTIDGKPFANNKSEGLRVQLGKKQLPESLEKALYGKSAEADFNVPMGFPADHPNKILAGQLADFSMHVKNVHAPRAVKVDDVFAKAMGTKDVEDLRKKIREEMVRADEATARENMKQQISEAMLTHEFDLPPTLLAQEREGMMAQIQSMQQQLSPEEQTRAAAEMGKIEENVKGMAEKRVRVALVLSRIAREQKVEVSSETLRAAIEEDIQRYPAKPEQARKIYAEHPEIAQKLHAQILEEKTIDAIIKIAKIKEKKVSRKELYALPEEASDKQSLTGLSA